MSVTHIRESELRWQVIVELRTVAIEAWIPKASTMDDVARFCDAVKDGMRRRMAAKKGRAHGEVEGQSKGAVSGSDEAGPAEKEEDPKGGGSQGGPDSAA